MQVSPSSLFAIGASLLSSGCRFGGGGHGSGVSGEGGPDYNIQWLQCDGRILSVVLFPTRLHADEREMAWSCRTKDGTDGSVTVDGQRFDISKGAVFLVSTNDKKTKVEQLAVDMSKLQGAPHPQGASMREKLQALGGAEPRIAEFFKDSRALK